MTDKTCRDCGITKPVTEFYHHRAKCKECVRAIARTWYAEHSEGYIERITESGAAQDWRRAKQMRDRGVPVLEVVHRRVVFDRANGRCQSCGVALTFRGGWHLDHVVPVAQGGEHGYANAQALCPPCHKRKTASENAASPSRPSAPPRGAERLRDATEAAPVNPGRIPNLDRLPEDRNWLKGRTP